MKVIVHEAPAQKPHGNALTSQRKDALEGQEVGLPMKNDCPAITPVDNVIAATTKSKPKRTRHEGKLQVQGQGATKK